MIDGQERIHTWPCLRLISQTNGGKQKLSLISEQIETDIYLSLGVWRAQSLTVLLEAQRMEVAAFCVLAVMDGLRSETPGYRHLRAPI